MNLRWLEDFLALCETGSFTEAARRRFLTQSALSKHMQALETWLGAGRLFDRSTNPVEMTSVGLSFRETASEIVMRLNAVRRGAISGGNIKSIYVSSTHSLSATFVPALSKIIQVRPSGMQMCLHVTASNFSEALSLYERGECDYFLCYGSRVRDIALDAEEHSRLTLGADYLVPVSAPVKGTRKPCHVLACASDRQLPFLGYTEDSHLGRVLQGHQAYIDIADRLVPHARSAYGETLRAGVLAGMGIAWLPYSVVRGNLERAELSLASDDVAYFVPLTIDVYRRKGIARGEVLKCWELWQAHVANFQHLEPALPQMASGRDLLSAQIAGRSS